MSFDDVRDTSLFPWRAPLREDWLERWKVADAQIRTLAKSDDSVDTAALCVELRRLAGQQLGSSEHLKLEGSARRLLPHAEKMKQLRRYRVGLLGNRTLNYLINPLRAAGLARGLLMDAVEAPYDSAASFAFGNADIFGPEKLDAVVVVLDEAAFHRPPGLLDAAAEDAAIAEAEQFLSRIAASVRERFGVPMIVANIPSLVARVSSVDTALSGSDARFLWRLNMTIAAGAARRDWILWDLADLAARVGRDRWFDPIRFHEAKTPFRIEICPLVADHLCRIVAALAGKACRALILDLDNTLWGGVIGDDGVSGIRLGQNSPEGEAYVAFQRFALELRRRGVVIAVCSKNTDEVAREPFRTHPEMLLKEEHIAVFQANWVDKATNIKAIAETLDLGLESLAFVDDNPAERERVRQELPFVSVPEVGADPAFYEQMICDSGAFEHILLNADDLGRAESYESNARRAELQTKVGNYDEYLASLKMVLSIERFDAVGRPRIAQLINKSNQFNLTTRRYNEEDVRKAEEDRDGVLCWQARLDDTFGQHGMIGVVIVRKGAKQWTIDTWLMSCRVLMRGVEETLMNRLMAIAKDAGVTEIIGEYVPTDRNGMVADFYPRLGFEQMPATGGTMRFRADPAQFAALKSFISMRDENVV